MKIIILLLVLLPSIAFASESGDAVVNLLNNVVYPILGPLLLGLGTLLLNIIRKKWNLQISADTEAMLLGQAKNAIGYAEELASAYLKEKEIQLTGSEKLNRAIQQLMISAPKISADQAEALIHSALGLVSGAGATGDKAVK